MLKGNFKTTDTHEELSALTKIINKNRITNNTHNSERNEFIKCEIKTIAHNERISLHLLLIHLIKKYLKRKEYRNQIMEYHFMITITIINMLIIL